MRSLTPRSYAHHYGPGRNADHWVYRCFDDAGVLLYVGCTCNVAQRIAAHRRGGTQRASRWLQVSMARHETQGPYFNRDRGRDAERAAIAAEAPLFNYQERRDAAPWQTRNPIAKYLVERGHIALALDTTCVCDGATKSVDAYDAHCFAHVAAQVAGLTRLRNWDELSEAEQDAAFAQYAA